MATVHNPPEPTLRRSRYYGVGTAVLTCGALVGAVFASGILQSVAFVAVGLFGALFAEWLVGQPLPPVARVFRNVLVFAAGLGVGLLLAWSTRAMGHESAASYPGTDGLVADFASGRGGPIRTAFGTHISLLSDSVWNLKSKVWYERVDESSAEGNGFLRIHYQLEPVGATGPYTGIYFDFSTPPPVVYDLTRFRRIAMRLRSAPSSTANPIDIAVTLYSLNQTNFEYAFPTWHVPRQNLRSEWTPVAGAFSDFQRPAFVSYQVQLDPSRVYRVALVISADRLEPVHGHLDVDDIRFE